MGQLERFLEEASCLVLFRFISALERMKVNKLQLNPDRSPTCGGRNDPRTDASLVLVRVAFLLKEEVYTFRMLLYLGLLMDKWVTVVARVGFPQLY